MGETNRSTKARYRFEQARQQFTATLRQIADCVDALDVNELPEVLVRLSGPPRSWRGWRG